MDALNTSEHREMGFYNISYYKTLKKYLTVVGIDPHQINRAHKIIFAMALGSVLSMFIPAVAQIFSAMREHNIDDVLEVIPIATAVLTTIVKLITVIVFKENFVKISNLVEKQWRQLDVTNELRIMDEVTGEGDKIVQYYKSALFGSLGMFVLIPVSPIFLDIILPLNETRSRRQLFKLNYFINEEDHFYPLYVHATWCSMVCVVSIVTVDSLYMIVTHHACGLFAVCGYQIKRATEDIDLKSDQVAIEHQSYQQFRECVSAHCRALEFYELVNNSSRNSYLIQITLNMVGISVTSVQTVMHLDEPAEVLRIGVLLGSTQFHLLFNSLPGQRLVDYSLRMANDTYSSKWYQTPVKTQRLIQMIQMRSAVPCTLSAGGLYDMNIENFGMIFKTCMSYFTMLMSLRE